MPIKYGNKASKSADHAALERVAAGYVESPELDDIRRRRDRGELTMTPGLRLALGYNDVGKEATRRLERLTNSDRD